MDKETQEKIGQLQMIEQGMQSFMMQKQQFRAQLMEVESALKELEGTEEAFKIVGTIMIKAEKKDLVKELDEKKERLSLRIKSIETQENKLKEKSASMQKEVMKQLKE